MTEIPKEHESTLRAAWNGTARMGPVASLSVVAAALILLLGYLFYTQSDVAVWLLIFGGTGLVTLYRLHRAQALIRLLAPLPKDP